ncbi:MAG: rhodanese-like domain-containing protein [Rubrobacteraceae bacterium]
MADVKTIKREELLEKIDRGDDFVLLETLAEEAYQRGHLPGALQFSDMDRASEVAPDKATEVITYCSNFN